MILLDMLAEKVFGILKGFGYQIKLYTADGNETVDPVEARRFFVADNGIMITIDDDNNEVHLSKGNTDSIHDTKKLQHNIKSLANEYLMNYTVRNYGKSIQPRDFSYQAKQLRGSEMTEGSIMKGDKKVAEGLSKLRGSKKTSHQTLENVRILVKHRQPVDEESRGARSRNIHSVFLEHNGERLRFPHNNLVGARAMARHMTHGGTMQDKVGQYVIESVGHLIKLNEFYRYARTNHLINEDTTDIITTIRENIESVRTELKRLSGSKTYESIRSRIEEQDEIELHEEDISALRDMFTVKRFDEKFDDVLPVVNRLVQEKDQYLRRIEECSSNEVYLSPKSYSMDSVLEFKNSSSKVGHKLSEYSSRMIENSELASYLNGIGRKLCQEGELSVFEQTIVSNIIGNLRSQKLDETNKTEISESINYEKFFDSYNYLFI